MFPWYEESRDCHSPNVTWPISLNNKMFFVGQNLYDALQEMPKYLWEHIQNEQGKTALYLAVENGDSLMTWGSIAQGANVNHRDQSGRSPLHYAAQSGNLELTEMLINTGAILNALDNEEKLPITYAQEQGHEVVFRYLTRLEKMPERPVPTLGPTQHIPPTYLWVDAICINQSDPDERGHQVRLMDRIYSEADCVSIWLGKADPLTEHALSAVTQIAGCYEKFATSNVVPYSRNDARVFEAAGIKEIFTFTVERSCLSVPSEMVFQSLGYSRDYSCKTDPCLVRRLQIFV